MDVSSYLVFIKINKKIGKHYYCVHFTDKCMPQIPRICATAYDWVIHEPFQIRPCRDVINRVSTGDMLPAPYTYDINFTKRLGKNSYLYTFKQIFLEKNFALYYRFIHTRHFIVAVAFVISFSGKRNPDRANKIAFCYIGITYNG